MNVHAVSIKGRRNQNEDKHTIIINGDGRNKNIASINLFAIYDGHGGKQISNFLQNNLPYYFVNKKVLYPLNKKYVSTVYSHIQKVLRTKYYTQAHHSGSTAVVVSYFTKNGKKYLNIVNLGDSRCILCRDDLAVALTVDHKPHWPNEKARIESIGGVIHYDGYDWRVRDLSVSRAFGDIDAEPYVTSEPDVRRYKLDPKDKFFLLACDGLWDIATDQEIANFILTNCYDKNRKRINKNVNISKKLAEYALAKGSTDNVSIICVFLD